MQKLLNRDSKAKFLVIYSFDLCL